MYGLSERFFWNIIVLLLTSVTDSILVIFVLNHPKIMVDFDRRESKYEKEQKKIREDLKRKKDKEAKILREQIERVT